MEDIRQRVFRLAESMAGQYGIELVDVEIAGSARKPFVRVYVDKEQGVTLDECERFSRALSALFDVEDPIPTAYVLEVSSPGLTRPLKSPRDFERSVGKLAKIVTREPIGSQNVFVGRIVKAAGGRLSVQEKDRDAVEIPLGLIAKARLEIELK